MNKRGFVSVGLVAAASTFSAAAVAQDYQGNGQVNTPGNAQVNAQANTPGNAQAGAEGNAGTPVYVPPADQPLITQAPSLKHRLSLDAGFGILGYTGGTASIGPAWNARLGFAITQRWGLEADYTGSYNNRPFINQNMVYTSVDGNVRYNILRPDQAPITPYASVGAGWAAYSGQYGDGAALVVPLSIGAERDITSGIKAGARFQFRPAFGDNLGSLTGTGPQAGGDTWNLLAHIGGQF